MLVYHWLSHPSMLLSTVAYNSCQLVLSKHIPIVTLFFQQVLSSIGMTLPSSQLLPKSLSSSNRPGILTLEAG